MAAVRTWRRRSPPPSKAPHRWLPSRQQHQPLLPVLGCLQNHTVCVLRTLRFSLRHRTSLGGCPRGWPTRQPAARSEVTPLHNYTVSAPLTRSRLRPVHVRKESRLRLARLVLQGDPEHNTGQGVLRCPSTPQHPLQLAAYFLSHLRRTWSDGRTLGRRDISINVVSLSACGAV